MKMSKFEEETKMDGFLKFVIAILIIIVTGIAALVGFGFHLAAEEERYIESLSPDELKKYQEEKEAQRQRYIKKYDVIAVDKYAKITGDWRNTKTKICYSFSYIEGNTLKHINDFEHTDYGLYKVIIGDKDQYIIDTYGETIYYLQLTKETLQKIGGS